jgi:YlmC/YmxH family sporulation protein
MGAHRIYKGGVSMRICELKQKEVINICDCRRLGFVGDVDFDMETGCLLAIIVPGPGCFCGFLVREKEFVIPFCDIRQVGPDIILVNVDLEKATERCGI